MVYKWDGEIDEYKYEKYQDVYIEDFILTKYDNNIYLVDIEE